MEQETGASCSSPPPFSQHHHRVRKLHLVDLYDDLLLLVFSRLDPLPDLFNLRRTCKRFAELGRAPELTLLVVGEEEDEGGEATTVTSRKRFRARECHLRLSEAVAAARPGDAIRVSSKKEKHHRVDSTVRISVPLLIEGCGGSADETVLIAALSSTSKLPLPLLSSSSSCCPPSPGNELTEETAIFRGDPEAALSFSAPAAVLRNLSIVVSASPSSSSVAVLHKSGRVTVDRCSLVGGGGGGGGGSLSHLVAPVVTTAVDEGVLRVEETKISRSGSSSSFGGGGVAIRAEGTGVLSSVRSVPLSRGGALLWAEVDAERSREEEEKLAQSDCSSGSCRDVVLCSSFVDALPTAAEIRAAAAAAAAAVATP